MPECPECKSKMHRSGFSWSGRKKVQRWRCNKCGRTTIVVKKEATQNELQS
jgi:transposase-like protein